MVSYSDLGKRGWLPPAEVEKLRGEIERLRATLRMNPGDDEPAIDLLAKTMAGAELNYRAAYERHGGSHIETGRCWDKMRRAGDAIRQHYFEIEEGGVAEQHAREGR